MKKTTFNNSKPVEADFSNAHLSSSAFDNCNMRLAKFGNTILEKADRRTFFNYSINPQIIKLKKLSFLYLVSLVFLILMILI